MSKKLETCEDEAPVFVEWKSRKIPFSASQFKFPHRLKVIDASFSNSSPDVLYMMTRNAVFSLHIGTLAFNKMVLDLSNFQVSFSMHILSKLHCHDQFIYISLENIVTCIICKCMIIEDSNKLRIASSTRRLNGCHILALKLVAGHLLVWRSCGDLLIMDSDTMALLLRIGVEPIDCNDIAISKDNKLHVATNVGVYVYTTTDGTYANQSYLDGERCLDIACTSNGYNIVGMRARMPAIVGTMGKVAVVSSDDLTPIYFLSMTNMSFDRVWYNAGNDSLAIVNTCELLTLEVYKPRPFSLFSLCMSTVILYVDELPVDCLPPRLYKLLQKYIK